MNEREIKLKDDRQLSAVRETARGNRLATPTRHVGFRLVYGGGNGVPFAFTRDLDLLRNVRHETGRGVQLCLQQLNEVSTVDRWTQSDHAVPFGFVIHGTTADLNHSVSFLRFGVSFDFGGGGGGGRHCKRESAICDRERARMSQ